MSIGLIFLVLQITDIILASAYYIFGPYMQLKFSAFKNTACEMFAYLLKTIISIILPTIYRLDIAQIFALVISIIFYVFVFIRHFKILKTGEIVKNKIIKN